MTSAKQASPEVGHMAAEAQASAERIERAAEARMFERCNHLAFIEFLLAQHGEYRYGDWAVKRYGLTRWRVYYLNRQTKRPGCPGDHGSVLEAVAEMCRVIVGRIESISRKVS